MTVYGNLENAKTRHANSAVVDMTIDGQIVRVAELAGITVRESGGTDGTYTVGTAEPHEHLHNRYTCNVSVNRFVWRETAMRMFNISQRGLLDLPNFDITATDEADGEKLFTIIGCTLSDRSQALQANQRLMSDMSLLALRTQNVDQPAPRATGGLLTPTDPGDVVAASVMDLFSDFG